MLHSIHVRMLCFFSHFPDIDFHIIPPKFSIN
eukprot:UN19309